MSTSLVSASGPVSERSGRKPRLLLLFELPNASLAELASLYDPTVAPTPDERRRSTQVEGECFDAVLTSGNVGLTADEMDRMPRLQLIGAFGAGHEAIDRVHAQRRGIAVVNGPGTNDDCVADHALALLLAALRRVPEMDRACRTGLWRDDLPMPAQLAGARVGLLGMGRIGCRIARRLEAFDAIVGYHARTRRADVPHAYHARLLDLAHWCDHLVVAAPGGPHTHHLLGREALDAIGPQGLLVNVGRGSIVETEALASALAERTLGGAALDVFEGEPGIPAALLAQDRAIVTPHVGGSSPQAYAAAVRLFLDNSRRHFDGLPLLTPVR